MHRGNSKLDRIVKEISSEAGIEAKVPISEEQGSAVVLVGVDPFVHSILSLRSWNQKGVSSCVRAYHTHENLLDYTSTL
jgi:hypothetical protein